MNSDGPAPREADPSLRRVQRDSVVIAVAAAALALILQRGRPGGALGVLAGAALMALSYRAISGAVTVVVTKAAEPAGAAPAATGASRRRVATAMVKFIGRYLVIGLAAWAVLVPLRAHPLGLFTGVTVPVLAIAIEAIRLARAPSGRAGDT